MYAEQELQQLIALARKAGAELDVTNEGGSGLVATVQVKSGIRGIGPHPMSAMFACERLREAKASGHLGLVIRDVMIGPMPRPMPHGMGDQMPSVKATLSDGQVKTLFSYYPDELTFTREEFIGKTEEEAHQLFAHKDREFLRAQVPVESNRG